MIHNYNNNLCCGKETQIECQKKTVTADKRVREEVELQFCAVAQSYTRR